MNSVGDNSGATGGAGLGEIATRLQGSNQLMGELIKVMRALFPRATGSFTMAAAASKVITDASVTSSSVVVLVPSNAAAAVLQGTTEHLYPTSSAGSFTVATGAGTNAAGTETFKYLVFNPL